MSAIFGSMGALLASILGFLGARRYVKSNNRKINVEADAVAVDTANQVVRMLSEQLNDYGKRIRTLEAESENTKLQLVESKRERDLMAQHIKRLEHIMRSNNLPVPEFP